MWSTNRQEESRRQERERWLTIVRPHALRLLTERTVKLPFTTSLIQLVLNDCSTDLTELEEYVGQITELPSKRWPQALAVAVALASSWNREEFLLVAGELGIELSEGDLSIDVALSIRPKGGPPAAGGGPPRRTTHSPMRCPRETRHGVPTLMVGTPLHRGACIYQSRARKVCHGQENHGGPFSRGAAASGGSARRKLPANRASQLHGLVRPASARPDVSRAGGSVCDGCQTKGLAPGDTAEAAQNSQGVSPAVGIGLPAICPRRRPARPAWAGSSIDVMHTLNRRLHDFTPRQSGGIALAAIREAAPYSCHTA